MHVDGAWGGSAILSKVQRPRVAGAERADSFSWNPHKMMGATLQCCAFITRHVGLLLNANGANAAYLFQPDKEYRELDYGNNTTTVNMRRGEPGSTLTPGGLKSTLNPNPRPR